MKFIDGKLKGWCSRASEIDNLTSDAWSSVKTQDFLWSCPL